MRRCEPWLTPACCFSILVGQRRQSTDASWGLHLRTDSPAKCRVGLPIAELGNWQAAPDATHRFARPRSPLDHDPRTQESPSFPRDMAKLPMWFGSWIPIYKSNYLPLVRNHLSGRQWITLGLKQLHFRQTFHFSSVMSYKAEQIGSDYHSVTQSLGLILF